MHFDLMIEPTRQTSHTNDFEAYIQEKPLLAAAGYKRNKGFDRFAIPSILV